MPSIMKLAAFLLIGAVTLAAALPTPTADAIVARDASAEAEAEPQLRFIKRQGYCIGNNDPNC